MSKWIMSSSPHIHSGDTIEKNMYGVLVALVPAFIVSLTYFGLGALIVIAVSIASCVFFEFLIQKFLIRGDLTICDGSALLTGVLLAFCLPSNLPVWIILIGALVAIGIGKMLFGGLGKNIFNPALVGYVFLLIFFPRQMNSWPTPGFFPIEYPDAITGATSLSMIKNHFGAISAEMSMLLGNRGGSLGETGALALILGFVYMLWRKIITWHIPVSIIGTVFIFNLVVYWVFPGEYPFAFPLWQILSGGLLLGAIFMATDYVTSPMTQKGMLIYGLGIGILTSVIRLSGLYPEGISFAILIMNAVTPLLNLYVRPKRFGKIVKGR